MHGGCQLATFQGLEGAVWSLASLCKHINPKPLIYINNWGMDARPSLPLLLLLMHWSQEQQKQQWCNLIGLFPLCPAQPPVWTRATSCSSTAKVRHWSTAWLCVISLFGLILAQQGCRGKSVLTCWRLCSLDLFTAPKKPYVTNSLHKELAQA